MFSPLALTQTLPFLPLAQGDIDYQVARRGDPDLFDTLFADPVTKVILVRGGLLAVPRGQGNAVNYASANMRLSTLPGAYAGSALAVHPEVVPIFLGSYGALRNEHVVALDITRMSAPGAASAIPSPSLGADAAFDADGNAPGAVAPDRLDMLEQAVERFDWVDLRGFAAHANALNTPQDTPDRFQHIPALVIVEFQQLGHHLRIGIGYKCDPLAKQVLLDFQVIFNNAVMNQCNLAVFTDMGMRIDIVRLSMGRPAGVSDSKGPL